MDGLHGDDTYAALVALRDRLADAIEAAKPGELAPLARQYVDVAVRIDSMTAPEHSSYDELTGHRARRRAALSDGTGTDGQ